MAESAKPLRTRLWKARALIKEWHKTVYDSERDRSDGPARGSVSEGAAAELARFDEAAQALTEAIKAAKGQP